MESNPNKHITFPVGVYRQQIQMNNLFIHFHRIQLKIRDPVVSDTSTMNSSHSLTNLEFEIEFRSYMGAKKQKEEGRRS